MCIENSDTLIKNEPISVLTYIARHRKTYDTLCLLKAKGYKNVTVYAIPFQYKKVFKPILEHRPEMIWDIDTREICKNFNYNYFEINSYDEVSLADGSIVLVCGAGLLPEEFIHNYKIINAHPGYIPNCRGLDALKWAIYEKQPIGVTSHLIGNEVDAGEVIIRNRIQVYENDTFHAVAQRVYENEIDVLVKSIQVVLSGEKLTYISGMETIVHKRMPKDIECKLLDVFEEYKSIIGS
jgi:phosphoribosylglycinamide formyltransferase-1